MYGKEAIVMPMIVGMRKQKIPVLQNQNVRGNQVQILDGVRKQNAGVTIL